MDQIVRKTSICIVLNAKGVGGAEKVCWEIANYLNKFEKYKVTLIHLTSFGGIGEYIEKGVEIKNFNLSRGIESVKTIKNYLKKIELIFYLQISGH